MVPAEIAADWKWVNLPGGHVEEVIVDACQLGGGDARLPVPGIGELEAEAGVAGLGRCCIVVHTNALTAFHVIFSHTGQPSRGTDEPVLRFVVGKRKNTMTCVGLGNPYPRKEPIDFTKHPDALLTWDAEKSRTYWFLYDRNVNVAAMGVQSSPTPDTCRLVCRFRDSVGFRAEVCEGLRYISISSGKRPVSLRVVRVGAPPDICIPRLRFDPTTWCSLPWDGNSVVFELDEERRNIVEKIQEMLAASPIAPFYGLVNPRFVCLNPYRMLDPLRRMDLHPGQYSDDLEWQACHDEVHERLAPILSSAPWTYWPMRFEKVDCTHITLSPIGPGCRAMVSDWSKAVQAASQLRNGVTNREMLTVRFAFEVYPVEGEHATQARRELIREIGALLTDSWGIMEFRAPFLACWRTDVEYTPYAGAGAGNAARGAT